MLLEKILQSQGFGSRKQCQSLIKQGMVKIAGEVCDQPKMQIDPQNLQFQVGQQHALYREQVYIALNKPQGYECSHQAQYHFSVFELFPEYLRERGIQTVGRLDQDTTGLILLTDDGKFLQALTHPKKHVDKEYWLTTADPITSEQIQQLEQGVELRNEKGIFQATQLQQTSEHELRMTIHQGVYHQVKRMLAAVGNKVTELHRHRVGQFALPEELKHGEWIYLTPEQVELATARIQD
ncbi:16S rRNA pseudouridine(516) synthase [Acinetobacter sp. ANC 4633]|uniref:pseudouridine synthase n=1 Tax=Acinetobacter sp. ANC 4633 TaxID=2529845 RepID=UPI00103B04FE|nr:16S rRNA pseudouridine(516) synthase [Acinetobacter sp. ANC 4633]TCB28571.1 16S rRNA pseudouridine(516) synthase [Acinetobacter sp. ANC 4633]